MSGILFVDVQAVGSPGNGFLLEIAWKELGEPAHSFLFRNESTLVPRRVAALTGISPEDLTGPEALPAEEIEHLFTAALNSENPVLLIAHHAVYEKKWLEHLTGRELEILCTRELALQRIDGLRSGSLRAVAGRIGYSMQEKRRSAHHATATEMIYKALEEGFSHDPGIRSKRLSLPECPGVYRFLDPEGKVLYVGKAKNLRNRVNSHFTGRSRGRRSEMLARTSDIDFEVHSTPLHAAIRESDLICSLAPEYNRAGKITDDRLWYLSPDLVHVSESMESGCFGPFISRTQIGAFAQLVSAMKTKENKATIVDNFFTDLPEGLFDEVFDPWKDEVLAAGILKWGREYRPVEPEEDNVDEKPREKEPDAESAVESLNGMISFGTALCRRAALKRMLPGCRLSWGSSDRGKTVENFVENSLNLPMDQSLVRRMTVLLSEIRRLHRSGGSPVLYLRTGRTLSGERLSYLLDSV